MKLFSTFLLLMAVLQLNAQQNISDVRGLNEGETVTISGIITNGDELGSIRYIQDNTGGLAIYDNNLPDIEPGDSITITGKIDSYNNLFEIVSTSGLTIHSSNNELPQPKVITIDKIGEDYEGQLIQINNIEIENANGTFAGNKNYNITNGSETGVFRTNNSSPVVGQVIPTGKINIVAICSQYSFSSNDTRTGYQILPRTMDDFITNDRINFTSPIEISSISKTGFSLSWNTDVNASAEVIYGLTNDPETWTNFASGTTNQNNDEYYQEVELSGFDPATIVYAKAFSVYNSDTTFSSVEVFVTESNSSGEIKVYFNTDINSDVSTESVAMDIGKAMEDTLIAYINRAEESIEFCIYNINNDGLSDVSGALNAAHNRGVRIRFITSGTTAHSGVDDLDSGIPVLESPNNSQTGLMHNKFASIDANSNDPLKPWVWSGSTNLTYDQVNSDANNMIFIQDQSLALTYQIEFEEMWGGNSDQPNSSKSKFGADKTDNTPHEFIVGGNRIQSYFSPSDGTNQQIIKSISTADNDLNVETMLITRSDLANAIKDAEERGVEVHVITNAAGTNTSTVNDILNAALPAGKFIFDGSARAMLHHKLAIIDANFAASDPQVITGSHNWSNAANDRNDENTLIIHNAKIANEYFQQFAYRFAENGGDLLVSAENIEIENVTVYPNPAVEKVTVSSADPLKTIQLFSALGTKIFEINSFFSNQTEIDLSSYESGLYVLQIQTENNQLNSYKIIKK